MAYAIKKLDGSTEYTLTDAEYNTMQAAIQADGQCALPNGNDVWIYIATDGNKDTLLATLASEHGADNDAFRIAFQS